MGDNVKIRERMNTYRSILLVLVWIIAGVGIIAGLVMLGNMYSAGIGVVVIIVSAIIGVIGHFSVNVLLAIPFILLNNGDILAALTSQDGKGAVVLGSNAQAVSGGEKTKSTNVPGTNEHGTFVKEAVCGRSGPEFGASEKEILNAGMEVTILETRGEWSKIRTPSGNEVWCYTSCLTSK